MEIENEIKSLKDKFNGLDNKFKTTQIKITNYEQALETKTYQLMVQEIKELTNKELQNQREKIKNEIENRKKELEITASQIFENLTFLKNVEEKIMAENKKTNRNLYKIIEQEITTQILNFDLIKKYNKLIKSYLRDNLKEIIDIVINNLVSEINKKYKYQYEVNNQLCLSIDSELKHLIRKLPISANSEKIVFDKITKTVQKIIEEKELISLQKNEVLMIEQNKTEVNRK